MEFGLYRTADGETLVLSSSDGYCSLVVFDKNELGKPTTLPPPRSLPTPAPTPLATPIPQMAHPHPAAPPAATGGLQTTLGSYLAPVSAPGADSGGASSSVKLEEDGEPKKKKKRAALVFEGPVHM